MKERGGRRSRGSKLKFRGPPFPRGTDISERKDEISNKKVVGKRKKPPPPQTRIDSFSLGRFDDLIGARSSIWGGPPPSIKNGSTGPQKRKKEGSVPPGSWLVGGKRTHNFSQLKQQKSKAPFLSTYGTSICTLTPGFLGWVGLGKGGEITMKFTSFV